MGGEKSFAKRILDSIVEQIESMSDEGLRESLRECQLLSTASCGIPEFQIGSVVQCLIDDELGKRKGSVGPGGAEGAAEGPGPVCQPALESTDS